MRLFSRISACARSMFGSVTDVFAADGHAVHSPRALCPLWSTYTTQTHGSVRDTLPHTVVYCGEFQWTGRFLQGIWSQCMYVCIRGGLLQPLHLDPEWSIVLNPCSTLHATFCALITLATPREGWTGSNPSRREGRGCGSTLSRSHSCSVRLVYTQISPVHIWTTLYKIIVLQ
jgi:hypothetical protein